MSMTSTSMTALATATCGWIDNAYAGQAVQDHGRYGNEIICTAPGSFCGFEPELNYVQCVPALTSSANTNASRTYSGITSVATGYTALFWTSCVDSANATKTTSNPYDLTCTDSAYPFCATINADLVAGVPPAPSTVEMITCVNSLIEANEALDPVTVVSNYSVEYVAMRPITMAQFTTPAPTGIQGLGNGGQPAVGPGAYTSQLSTTIDTNPKFSVASPAGGLRLTSVFAVALALSLLIS